MRVSSLLVYTVLGIVALAGEAGAKEVAGRWTGQVESSARILKGFRTQKASMKTTMGLRQEGNTLHVETRLHGGPNGDLVAHTQGTILSSSRNKRGDLTLKVQFGGIRYSVTAQELMNLGLAEEGSPIRVGVFNAHGVTTLTLQTDGMLDYQAQGHMRLSAEGEGARKIRKDVSSKSRGFLRPEFEGGDQPER